MDKKQLYKAYGIVIDSVLDKLGITERRTQAKKELGQTLFAIWKIEDDSVDVGEANSKTQLDRRSLALFINFILGYYAVRGVELDEPNVKGFDKLTLAEYYKIKENGR